MKNFYRNLKITCLVTFILASMSNLMAQRTVNVPAGALLNEAINGDTTATGERVDDNTIYELVRGQVYEVSSYIRLDVPLQIKSAEGNGTPAIIVLKDDGTGSYSQLIRTRGDLMLEDIYLSSSTGAGNQPTWGSIRTEGANTSIVLKKCLIEMDKACALQIREHGQRILIEDCIVGKTGDYNRNNGNGRLIDCREFNVTKIEVRNTTMYHLVDRIIRSMSGNVIDSLIFDQNTGLQIQGYHGLFQLGRIGYAKITNNLFLNPKYMGNWTNINEQTGPEPDNQNHYLVTADTISSNTEFYISNNNFYFDDEVLAFFERYDTVSRPEILAPIVATKMGDDAANAGWDLDFTFDNDIPTINYEYLDGIFIDPTLDPTTENWPMPAGLSIFNFNGDFTTSNEELITGSTTGGQLGDLNWIGTFAFRSGVKNINETDSRVYPNPAKDFISINIETSRSSEVFVNLFNIAGKLVQTNSFKVASGKQILPLDISNVSSGLYIYNIQTEKGLKTGKFSISK